MYGMMIIVPPLPHDFAASQMALRLIAAHLGLGLPACADFGQCFKLYSTAFKTVSF